MDLSENIDKRPTQYISFHDLKGIGFEFVVQEFNKTMEDGSVKNAVKVVNVTKNGVDFPKHYMSEILWVLGIDTRNQRYWVRTKQTHRSLQDQARVFDYRYMGYERLDPEWISSGRASDDAIAVSSKMLDMNEEFDQMRNGGDREPKK